MSGLLSDHLRERPNRAVLALFVLILGTTPAAAQDPTVDADVTDVETAVVYSAEEIDDLVAPVALYPDDLLAVVLPAASYPLQIVQAARFLDMSAEDDSLEPNTAWADSVIALLNYPDALHLLDQDLNWTFQLGEAVVYQQQEVMAAIERFRALAYAAGNLYSDERQVVTVAEDFIEIEPVDQQEIYVPYYDPVRVLRHQAIREYYYYPQPYPVYYYPYPDGHRFRLGYFWGVTSVFRLGWSTRHLHVTHVSHLNHPYHGYVYGAHHYRGHMRSHGQLPRNYADGSNSWHHNYSDFWRPHYRHGLQADWGRRHHRSERVASRSGRDDRGQQEKVANARTSAGQRHSQRDSHHNGNRQATPTRSNQNAQRKQSNVAQNRQRVVQASSHGRRFGSPSTSRGQRRDADLAHSRQQAPRTTLNRRQARANSASSEPQPQLIRTVQPVRRSADLAYNRSTVIRTTTRGSRSSATPGNTRQRQNLQPAQRAAPRTTSRNGAATSRHAGRQARERASSSRYNR